MSNKPMKAFLAIFSFFIVSVLITGGYFWNQLNFNSQLSEEQIKNEGLVFEIVPGQTLTAVTKKLAEQKIIKNDLVFLVFAKSKGFATKIKRGEYLLHPQMSSEQILSIISSGKSIAHPITLAEGLNIFEISDLIVKNNLGTKEEFLSLIKNKEFIKSLLGEEQESLEGYLFPETYQITKYDNLKDLVTQMVKRFLAVYSELEPQIEQFHIKFPQRQWNRQQIVTMASIIEKETGASQERPLISSVFHNRIDKGMKLQTDPTVIYGVSLEKGETVKNISKQDLLTPTRHNTYVINGLPATPIANPGKEALQAAINPASSNYLFFVSHNNGTHEFTETYEKHVEAVQKFQLDPKAREGKSWRDLKTNESKK